MIDVIIPAYNAHKTLEKTLLSINMQTINNKLKVYIINDGSDKNYDAIVNKFKSKMNINVINLNTNRGPGNARNEGIINSSSEYLLFIDADDELVNSLSLELLINNIKDYDVCIGGVIVENNDSSLVYKSNYKNTLHGKLYRRKFIIENKIFFNNSYRSEDNSFHNLLMLLKPKVSYIDEPIYFYKFNKNSLSDTSKDKFIRDYNFNINWVVEELKNRDVDPIVIAEYIYKSFIYNYYLFIDFDCSFDELLVSFKEYILDSFEEYKNILNKEKKLEIINEYEISKIAYISIDEFYGLLLK